MIRIHETFRLSPSPGPGPARRMFRLSSAAPVLRVPDLERTCRWYAQELGFNVIWMDGELELCRAVLALDDVQLLIKPMSPEEPCLRRLGSLSSTISLCVPVVGIDALYAKLVSCVRLLRPSNRRTSGIGSLIIEDLDGTLIVFSEEEDSLNPAGP